MTRIYCISGLGADKRVFSNIKIDGVKLIHLPWPKYDLNDSLQNYAKKIAMQIEDVDAVVLGLSFGGMLAVEIAKHTKVKKVIVVSSAKTKEELPLIPAAIRWIVIKNFIPSFALSTPNFGLYHMFGVTEIKQKKLLAAIVRDTDTGFLKWALKAILTWNNVQVPGNIVHIHGTADRLIPAKNLTPDYWIEGGGHFMIFNCASEINEIIQKEIDDLDHT